MSHVRAWWYRSRWWWEDWARPKRIPGPERWLAFKGMKTSKATLATTQTYGRLLGHFGVAKHRLSSGGRYRSAPTLDTEGAVSGWARSASGFWPFLSYPSVRLGVTLTQTVKHGSIQKTKRRHERLVDIHDNWEYRVGYPGRLSFPSIEFDVDPSRSVHIDLDVKLTYFMLGDGHIDIGLGNKPFKIRLPQYNLVPI